jgi:invasion protein IalB
MLRPFSRLAALAAAAALTAGAAAAQQQDGQAQQQDGQAQPQAEAPAPSPSPNQLVETATHGDWTIVCLNGDKPCVMRQTGQAEGQDVMEMTVRRIEAQQTQQGTVEAVMDVRVPLGVLLREGVSLRIDEGEAQRGAYTICVPDGCLMREPLPNNFINLLKKGATANVGMVLARNGQAQNLEVPISLNGFTAAYNSLEP